MRDFDDYTENYDLIATDDLMEPKTPDIVKQRLADLIVPRVRGLVCDIGCGDGYLIRRSPGERIAVDIALAYLERLPSEMLRLWTRAEDIPLRSGSVDTIICTDVLEHVLDASKLAGEMSRLLATDGQLLVAFPFQQDLSVYDLPEYKARFGKYKYVHLRSLSDSVVELFPGFRLAFSELITEGVPLMLFKPYPIKLMQLVR